MKKNTYISKKPEAFEYALYMIAGSYFHKTVCKSHLMADSLCVKYKENKLEDQYHMEEICIRYMDSLAEKLPSQLFAADAKVFLVKETEGVKLNFQTEAYRLTFRCQRHGKRRRISCAVYAQAEK